MVGNGLKALFLLCCLLAATGSASAQAEPGCLDCHTDDADSPVHAVFKTAHGALNGGELHHLPWRQ